MSAPNLLRRPISTTHTFSISRTPDVRFYTSSVIDPPEHQMPMLVTSLPDNLNPIRRWPLIRRRKKETRTLFESSVLRCTRAISCEYIRIRTDEHRRQYRCLIAIKSRTRIDRDRRRSREFTVRDNTFLI